MAVVLDILNLLTTSPGGMVYYLVLLFSIWAIVGMALSRWSRDERRGFAARLFVAGALMSFGRLAFFIIALLDRQSGTHLVLLGPPLERLVDTLSGLLICWAFVIPLRQQMVGRAFIGVSSLFAVGLYVVAAISWASVLQGNDSAFYNLSWQRWAWELGQLTFLIPALVYLFVLPIQERGTLAISLSALAAGHLLQAVLPFSEQIPHFAGWVRFANLLTFPLLAVSAFRLIMQRFDIQAADLEAVNRESLSQITGLMDLLDINQKMYSSLALDSVVESAIHSVSQTLQSNLCALALVSQDVDGTIELPIVYSAPNTIKDHAPFHIDAHPAIRYAITRNKPVVLGPDENSQVPEVYGLLGSEQRGPLIVQPLAYQTVVSGLILVGRPGQSSPFTAVEVRKCETLSMHIAIALENARRSRQMEERIERQGADHRLLEIEHTRTKADLENRLSQKREEISRYVQKLYETEQSEQRAQGDARQLRQQLSRFKKASQNSIAQSKRELRDSIEQVVRLTKQIADLDAALLASKSRVQALEQERADLPSAGRRAQVEELDTLLDSLGCGVVFCDQQGQITRINAVAMHLLELDDEEWVGKPAFSLELNDDWQSALHSVTDRYSAEAILPKTLFVKREGYDLEVRLAPLQMDGHHLGAAITLYTVPTVDERTRARDEFLASLAQELRTPMTSIVGYTDLLIGESVGQLEGIQRKFLQRVQANIERMGGMLNDMIGVTAIDSGKLVIELEPVDVVRVIESALRKVQFRLEERELGTHLEIGDLPVIYADPEHVQQMVDNLLTNACKSSQPGSMIEIQAQVETDDTGSSHLHVAVSDTGGGIAPENRARAFERFYRADNALIAGLGETGVGLAIVKALVEAHKGHVWLESEMGRGSTFHFTIPFGLREKMGDRTRDSIISQRPTAGGNGRD